MRRKEEAQAGTPRAGHANSRSRRRRVGQALRLIRAGVPGGQRRVRNVRQLLAAVASRVRVAAVGRAADPGFPEMSAAGSVCIGLDLGTSALKALAMDADGCVLARARREYPTARAGADIAEQDPADWWRAATDALTELAAIDARKSRVVELRFFGGLTVEETAKTMGLNSATVRRDWTFAKAWLHHVISGGKSPA